MSDVLRRPRLRGDFCQVSNRIARIPTRGVTELWAQRLLIARISLPDEVDDFSGYAVRQLFVPRNSYHKAMRVLADWGFVVRTQRRVGLHDYEWTTEVEWGVDGRPVSTPRGGCTAPREGAVDHPPYNPPSYNTEHAVPSGWVGEGVPPATEEPQATAEGPPAGGADGRWDAAALAYEEHYLAAVANLPASKVSGRLTAENRRCLEALLESGVPVAELCETISGMVLEVSQGNHWRSDTPEGGFWHPLVFRRDNRVKFAEMWRRQSAVEERSSSSEARLRSRFGRLGR